MKFRLDRPTALYNGGLWLVLGGVLAASAFLVREWLPVLAWTVGAVALGAVVVATAVMIRPPWVVRIDDRLTVRGRRRVSVALTDIRDVRWVAGRLVVQSTAGQLRIPPVESEASVAETLRDRLDRM